MSDYCSTYPSSLLVKLPKKKSEGLSSYSGTVVSPKTVFLSTSRSKHSAMIDSVMPVTPQTFIFTNNTIIVDTF